MRRGGFADRSYCAGDQKTKRGGGQENRTTISALFGFLLFTLAFNVRGFMRELTKAKHALSMRN